jgi:hypothetical protein
MKPTSPSSSLGVSTTACAALNSGQAFAAMDRESRLEHFFLPLYFQQLPAHSRALPFTGVVFLLQKENL